MKRPALSLWHIEPHLLSKKPLDKKRSGRRADRGSAREAAARQLQHKEFSPTEQAPQKKQPPSLRKSGEGWTTKPLMLAAQDRQAEKLAVSLGNAPDAPEGWWKVVAPEERSDQSDSQSSVANG